MYLFFNVLILCVYSVSPIHKVQVLELAFRRKKCYQNFPTTTSILIFTCKMCFECGAEYSKSKTMVPISHNIYLLLFGSQIMSHFSQLESQWPQHIGCRKNLPSSTKHVVTVFRITALVKLAVSTWVGLWADKGWCVCQKKKTKIKPTKGSSESTAAIL